MDSPVGQQLERVRLCFCFPALQGIVFDFDFQYRFGPTGVLYVNPRSEVIIKCISPTKLMPTLNYTVYDELSPVFIIKAGWYRRLAVSLTICLEIAPSEAIDMP